MIVRQKPCPQVLTSHTYVHQKFCIEYKWQEQSSVIEAVILLLATHGVSVNNMWRSTVYT